MMNGFLGEFLGTMILIVLGVGCGAGISLNKAYAKGQGWLFVTLAWGMAVTFGFFSWSQVMPYLLGQFLGAFVGAALVILHYYPHFKATKADEGNSVGIFATGPAISNPFFNFLSEMIATFVFIFTLLNLGNFTQGLKPLIVGFLIMVVGQALGSTTGFALNPARDFSPRLAYAILPVPNKGGANWAYAWVPVLGPIAGGLLASGLQALLK